MLTLKQIKSNLVEYFESHAQVNQVVFADDFEFNAERNLTYPCVNLEFLDASINNKNLNYNFKVVVADMVPADNTSAQLEVHSDALMVAEDFFSWLQQQEGWSFNKSTNIQKFTDDTGDRVSGVVFRVALSVIRSQNTCVTPLKS